MNHPRNLPELIREYEQFLGGGQGSVRQMEVRRFMNAWKLGLIGGEHDSSDPSDLSDLSAETNELTARVYHLIRTSLEPGFDRPHTIPSNPFPVTDANLTELVWGAYAPILQELVTLDSIATCNLMVVAALAPEYQTRICHAIWTNFLAFLQYQFGIVDWRGVDLEDAWTKLQTRPDDLKVASEYIRLLEWCDFEAIIPSIDDPLAREIILFWWTRAERIEASVPETISTLDQWFGREAGEWTARLVATVRGIARDPGPVEIELKGGEIVRNTMQKGYRATWTDTLYMVLRVIKKKWQTRKSIRSTGRSTGRSTSREPTGVANGSTSRSVVASSPSRGTLSRGAPKSDARKKGTRAISWKKVLMGTITVGGVVAQFSGYGLAGLVVTSTATDVLTTWWRKTSELQAARGTPLSQADLIEVQGEAKLKFDRQRADLISDETRKYVTPDIFQELGLAVLEANYEKLVPQYATCVDVLTDETRAEIIENLRDRGVQTPLQSAYTDVNHCHLVREYVEIELEEMNRFADKLNEMELTASTVLDAITSVNGSGQPLCTAIDPDVATVIYQDTQSTEIAYIPHVNEFEMGAVCVFSNSSHDSFQWTHQYKNIPELNNVARDARAAESDPVESVCAYLTETNGHGAVSTVHCNKR